MSSYYNILISFVHKLFSQFVSMIKNTDRPFILCRYKWN